jgi:phosphoesterase RecJ-like protein
MTDTNNQPAGEGLSRAEFERAWQAISSARTIFVLTHANPDADAIASTLALTDVLAKRGHAVTPVLAERVVPGSLQYIPGVQYLVPASDLDVTGVDLLLIVDCADLERLGPIYSLHPDWFDGTISIVNIDHHVTNSRYGAINLVDPTAAATCEVISLLFRELGVEIGPDVATCLLSGIYGDTLGLRTASTTSRTVRVTADLLDRGADLGLIVDSLFRMKPFSTLKLWAMVLERAEMLNGVVWTEITPEMLATSGATSAEGEGVINFLAGIKGAKIAILFYRQPDGWRVSLRSIADDVDVAKLARVYNGGGHSRAAGCRLKPGLETRDQFLLDIMARINPRECAPVSLLDEGYS